MCKLCNTKPVYELTNKRKFCSRCFCRFFEKKVFGTIRKYKMISADDKIVVACSGGKDSNTVLYILNKLAKSRKQKIAAFAVDEGIKPYREELLQELKKFCKNQKIGLKIFSFKNEFGFKMQDEKTQNKIKELKLTTCYICSILKRWLLNKKARQLGITKIATGHNMDDETETILLNQIKGNPELLAKLGPATGIKQQKKFVQRVKPLYFISGREIVLYAKIKKLPASQQACPLRQDTLRVQIRNFLNKLEMKHPEIKNAIINSFMKILPLLKEKYKNAEINSCKKCNEPSSAEICKCCKILDMLKKVK